ncbi:MAG: class I SAM-dependent methyltransferase [Candidatus Paceibacterota bacterium]|jgi:predicted O-methyltransferase YrrM
MQIVNRIKKALKERGVLGFVARLFIKMIEPARPFFWFLVAPIARWKITHLSEKQDIGRLFDFASTMCWGIIRPLQVREEILSFLKIVEEERPKVVLEIGTSFGGVLFLFSRVAHRDATIISIDLPGAQGGYPEWRKSIYKIFTLFNQSISLIKADSHSKETLSKVETILENKSVDLLFIDGDHTYEGAKHDFLMYKGLVRKGGIIAFHDVAQHSSESGCEVSRLWGEMKDAGKIVEIIKDKGQGWGGIGLFYVS